MPPNYKPTPEQAQIIDAAKGKDSLMCNAYAGCAKSTTLEMAAPQVKVPALLLAFNKKIATDAGKRMPGNFAVKTMNGLGHGAWARRDGAGASLALDDRKLGKLITQISKDRQMELSSDQWDEVRKLVSKAMQNGLVPEGSGEPGFIPDSPDDWRDCALQVGMLSDDFEFVYELAREVLIEDIRLARAGTVSFDDQVYCSTLLGGKFPQFPVVFVDEAQDLSPLNHKMVELTLRDQGRLFVVGDEKQAIYAFRGADGQSMRSMERLRESWTKLPLATTFRCPKAIVARQRGHAPGFTAWHTNAEGTVSRLGHNAPNGPESAELAPIWGWHDVQRALPSPTAEVAVLCRNNGPLLSLAFKLIRQNIGVVMLGRDIGKGLISLSRKILPDDSTPVEHCKGLVADWMLNESSKARANGLSTASIEDRGDCLLAVLDAGVRDAGQLRVALQRLFARESGQVTLGSIHRSKGLEWDLVLHLDPWRMPSRYAREAAKAGDPVPLEQEHNLIYVAETRTKHTLLTADLEGFR